MSAWCVAHKPHGVLTELAIAVAATVKAHARRKLSVNLSVVAKALATLAVSAFMADSEPLRQDLADIIGVGSQDGASLVKRYREAALSGDIGVVGAVDRRITCDPLWGQWAQGFLKVGGEMCAPQTTTTDWVFPEVLMSESNGNGIRHWLFRRR